MPHASIKDQVLKISEDYLGPAAERFIDRQVSTHLNKSPEKLTRDDVRELIDWLKLSLTILTDDRKIIEEYVSRLKKVA